MNFVKPATGFAPFTLIHISDFHLCRPSGISFGRIRSKRLFSYLSWQIRRRNQHRPEILDALTRAVRQAKADMIAVTGDLTQLALPVEFEEARRRLQTLGPPDRVFVVPGNHDSLVPMPWSESFACWADYLAGDSGGLQVPLEFPTLRIRGPIALIGLSSAQPTRPLSATGSLGHRQLLRLAAMLDETSRQNLFRVLLIHHPPQAGTVSFRQRLVDADALRSIVQRHGAELILHGHSHCHSHVELDGPAVRIPVLGISSASAAGRDPERRAAFRSIRIIRSSEGWTTDFQDHFFAEERNDRMPSVNRNMAGQSSRNPNRRDPCEGSCGVGFLSTPSAGNSSPKRHANWGKLIGACVYRLDRRHRTIVQQNLKFAFPSWTEHQVAEVSKGTFRNFGLALTEMLQLARMSRHDVIARCRLNGEEHMHRALEKGRGIILVSGHLGHWEFALQYLVCRFQTPIHLVVKPLSPRRLDGWLNRVRTRFGNRIISKKRAFPPMLKAVREGGIVALMVDLSRLKQSVAVNFFGHRARASHAISLLAARCGATVMPVFSHRDADGFMAIELGPPIILQRSRNLKGDLQHNTQLLTDAVETAVRQHPDQYLWMQKRWKDYHPYLYPGYRPRTEHLENASESALEKPERQDQNHAHRSQGGQQSRQVKD